MEMDESHKVEDQTEFANFILDVTVFKLVSYIHTSRFLFNSFVNMKLL